MGERRPTSGKFRVNVLTYDRPRLLLILLEDIAAWAPSGTEVVVFDDCSPCSYNAVERFLTERGWRFERLHPNRGKKLHWKVVVEAYRDAKRSDADYLVHLPDDVFLCQDFFHRALDAWTDIDDPRKIALNLLKDDRVNRPQWTQIEPVDCGSAIRTGWIDGAFLTERGQFLGTINFPQLKVPTAWWDLNPRRGSGVYACVSRMLVGQEHSLYCVKRSLLQHDVGPSKMNREAREGSPIRAVDFIDD